MELFLIVLAAIGFTCILIGLLVFITSLQNLFKKVHKQSRDIEYFKDLAHHRDRDIRDLAMRISEVEMELKNLKNNLSEFKSKKRKN